MISSVLWEMSNERIVEFSAYIYAMYNLYYYFYMMSELLPKLSKPF